MEFWGQHDDGASRSSRRGTPKQMPFWFNCNTVILLLSPQTLRLPKLFQQFLGSISWVSKCMVYCLFDLWNSLHFWMYLDYAWLNYWKEMTSPGMFWCLYAWVYFIFFKMDYLCYKGLQAYRFSVHFCCCCCYWSLSWNLSWRIHFVPGEKKSSKDSSGEKNLDIKITCTARNTCAFFFFWFGCQEITPMPIWYSSHFLSGWPWSNLSMKWLI